MAAAQLMFNHAVFLKLCKHTCPNTIMQKVSMISVPDKLQQLVIIELDALVGVHLQMASAEVGNGAKEES